jgi:hypothetical protein
MTKTNFQRAERAAKAFHGYATGDLADIYDLTSLVLADLLTDLMHFADRQTLDFERCLQHARTAHDEQAEELDF